MTIKDYLLSPLKNKDLLLALSLREIQSRYKGSILSSAWLVLTPFLMLFVYVFVFGTVLQSKWGDGSHNNSEFALILFLGLILFNFFSDCLNRSTLLIVSNENYVKKVVFPLEIIPLSLILSCLVQMFVGFFIWLVWYFISFGVIQYYGIYTIFVILPFIILVLAIVIFLSALSVYIRDLNQIVGLITTGLMFLSPLFFPIDRIPENFQIIVRLNPISVPIESIREMLYWGVEPNWQYIAIYSFVSIFSLFISIAFFNKLRDGFSDVL